MQTSVYCKHSIATMLLLLIFTCSLAQNVGIGTTAPKARLHVADSSVLFSGSSPLPAVAGLPPITGAGTRLMWYPAKAAIRAGGVSGVEWNETNIGQYSTAFGRNTIASGQYSTSFGVGSTVTGHGGATALGSNNVVSGNAATGIGFAVTAQSYGSLVIGRYNTIAGSSTSWVATDPLFVVGNGISAAAPNNALIIKKNGDAYFDANTTTNGNAIISGTTNINGDANVVGTTTLFGPANIYNTTTIKDNNDLIVEKNAGTAPIINLVPLGIVRVRVVFDRIAYDKCYASFTNIAGNFITGQTSECGDPTGSLSFVEGNFKFDSAQVAPYKDIIVVPNIIYNAQGGSSTAYTSLLSRTGTEVNYNLISNKPQSLYITMKSNDWGTFGVYSISGTVMLYGIR